MKTLSPNHLSNDQFTEIAIGGAPSRACGLHLAECAVCRDELSKFEESVGLFNRTSLAWSTAEADRSPRKKAARPAIRMFYAPAAWALAAALLVTIAVPVWKHDHPPARPVAESAQEDSAAQIAQDNQLLESVNVALSTNDASPLPEYRLSDGPYPAARAATRTETRIP